MRTMFLIYCLSMFKKAILPFFILILAGAGCVPDASNIDKTAKQTPSPKTAWANIAPDIDRYECDADTCGVRLIVYRFAKDKFAWRFANRSAPLTIAAWAAALPNAAFVTNGVYFDENFGPTGLLKTSGELVNNRQYDLDKTGLLILSPAPNVYDTATDKFDLEKSNEAAQSFPLLIKKGAAVASFKDKKSARRTFIGIDQEKNVYVGAVPEENVSFINLARLLSETGVKWNNVLNLDGGTSTGFALNAGDFKETMNSIVQVPNVIVAERK